MLSKEGKDFGYFSLDKQASFINFFFFSCSDTWTFPDADDDQLIEAARPYDQGYVDSGRTVFATFATIKIRPIVGQVLLVAVSTQSPYAHMYFRCLRVFQKTLL